MEILLLILWIGQCILSIWSIRWSIDKISSQYPTLGTPEEQWERDGGWLGANGVFAVIGCIPVFGLGVPLGAFLFSS